MNDDDLAKVCNITVEAVRKLPPAKRAIYDRLATVADELDLWQAGLGPKPRTVIVCRGHSAEPGKRKGRRHQHRP